jgi:DDE family transposase
MFMVYASLNVMKTLRRSTPNGRESIRSVSVLFQRLSEGQFPQRVALDMDSTEIQLYSQQEQSAYNGHFESICYHPLLRFDSILSMIAALPPPDG